MNYLYVMSVAAAAIFLLYAVTAQLRLNKHTDAQIKFLISARNYNFNPIKGIAKKTVKYAAFFAALLFAALIVITTLFYTKDGMPDFKLVAAVFGISLAAFFVNGVILTLCAVAYVRHKIRYTPIV